LNPFHIGDLTIPIPIVQGGMGIGISMSKLASAVANAGGIGIIATVGVGLIHGNDENSFRKNNIEGVIKEIRKARELTSGILGVNIMTVLTNFAELVKTAIQEKIDIIFSGAGLPLDLPSYKTASDHTQLVPIVSSDRAARIIARKWISTYNYVPDAFVIEGPKAGGHLGFSMDQLKNGHIQLPELVSELAKFTAELKAQYNKDVPIIAAGGIMNGKDIAELFKLGATAVQLGSRFIATEECDASDAFKQAIINSKESDIRIIKSPVGLPGRAIENHFLELAEQGKKRPNSCKFNCIKSCNPKTTEYCIADALHSAFLGNFDKGFAFSGANAHQIKSMTTVNDIFRQLQEEYQLEIQKSMNATA
jgi:nitronate monooxygenase